MPTRLDYESKVSERPGSGASRRPNRALIVGGWLGIAGLVVLSAYGYAGFDLLSSVHPHPAPPVDRLLAGTTYLAIAFVIRLLMRRYQMSRLNRP